MRKSKIISIILVIVGLISIGCSETLTPPNEDNSIEIEFPIGKKAIYAIGIYEGDITDSSKIENVNVFSLQFDSIITKSSGVEYVGLEESYYSSISGNGVYDYRESGKIVVSIDDKWVLFQTSEIQGSGEIFLKRNSILTDTTLIPTRLENQFPIFPSRINPNTNYSVYRPSDNDSSNFIGVQRDFSVKDFIDFSDIYGSNRGLNYSTVHILKFGNDMKLDIRGIVDSHGVVTSVISFEDSVIRTTDNPAGSDTVTIHQINRRIVDFTEPENVQELSYYADLVKENGLIYLEEN